MTTTVTTGRHSRLIMARSRGAVTGPLLMLLGIWGAIIPFVGHYFGYGFTPDNTWGWTAGRAWLEVAPGAAVLVGGALVTSSAHRASAMLGGWLAAAGGAWFVLGIVFMPLWNPGYIGTPVGDTTNQVLERVGMFYGLGALILFLSGVAIGRFSVIGVRDIAAAEAAAAAAGAATTREVDVRDRNAVYPATTTTGAAVPAEAPVTSTTAPVEGTTGTTTGTTAAPATEGTPTRTTSHRRVL